MDSVQKNLECVMNSWLFIILAFLGWVDIITRAATDGEVHVIKSILTGLTIVVEGILHV